MFPNLSPRKDRTGGCPACGGPDGTVRFDWRTARTEQGNEFAHYTRTLVQQKTLRSGLLYKCSLCGQKWWLSPGQDTMHLVPRDKLMLLEQWNSLPLVLNGDLLRAAKALGATPAHRLSGQADYAEVPCQVRTLGGEVLDKCLIVFRAFPPLESVPKPPRFVAEVAAILPSDLSLPYAVRLATTRSKPDRSGRAGTLCLDAAGKPLFLDWVVNFLDQPRKGSTLRLASPKAKRPRGPVPRYQGSEDLTIFLADWTPDIL